MKNLIEKALNSKSESKYIEFKQGFDPSSSQEWCELVKDIVAIANSGGGIIIFGLDSVGAPTGLSVEQISKVDPAEISNKVSRYTAYVALDCEILHLNKDGKDLVAFMSDKRKSTCKCRVGRQAIRSGNYRGCGGRCGAA